MQKTLTLFIEIRSIQNNLKAKGEVKVESYD